MELINESKREKPETGCFRQITSKKDRESITQSTFSVTSLFTLLPLVYKLHAGLMAAGNILVMLHFPKDFFQP